MRKEDLKDGMVVEVEFEYIPTERFIKLGNRLIGKGYVELYDITDGLSLNSEVSKSKITKIFKNKSMKDLEDINNDKYLELIWEREREIDWSKVPKWTPIQAWDENEKYTFDSLFVAYDPELKFGLIVADNKDDEPRGYKHCKIHPSVEIKEEWYK